MKSKNIKETTFICTILIQAYASADYYEDALEIFRRMLNTGMKIKEASYGLILESCTKAGKMNLVIDIYDSLNEHYFNMNSIVFTTIIKGFLKSKAFKEAIDFFKKIKHHKDLPGMIITYNCALDIYANQLDIQGALSLFEEI
jgi:pentatricopeptide repeat protein